ncbi:Mu transposase domain-containing protein [Peribacillus sp. B-H-3]|uniref:Mu transposase domain-containing protein n=1 Tax=Peribacillus sp. B-H-3 TaxID=3400420 RepID=UPI003B01B138
MREVSRDCFISYLGKKYSVPFRYAGHKVKVKVTLDHQIEIYDEKECVAKHPILTGKTSVHVKLEHYEGLHKTGKEQEHENPTGLAAKDSGNVPPPIVETRSLASYAALEEGDSI